MELGVAPLQLGQRRRQQIGRDRGDRSELQRPRQHPLPLLGVIEQVAHRGEDHPPATDDLRALLGQLDARLPPLDETDLKLVLKLLDLHAERGLGDRAGLGCPAEMEGPGQGLEVAQLAKGDHKARLCLVKGNTICTYHRR